MSNRNSTSSFAVKTESLLRKKTAHKLLSWVDVNIFTHYVCSHDSLCVSTFSSQALCQDQTLLAQSICWLSLRSSAYRPAKLFVYLSICLSATTNLFENSYTYWPQIFCNYKPLPMHWMASFYVKFTRRNVISPPMQTGCNKLFTEYSHVEMPSETFRFVLYSLGQNFDIDSKDKDGEEHKKSYSQGPLLEDT